MITLADPSSSLTIASPPVAIVAAGDDAAITVAAVSSIVAVAGQVADIVVTDPTITTGAATTAMVDLGTVAGALAIDAAAGNTVRATLVGDVSAISITGAPIGRSQRLVVYLAQDSVGGRRLSLPAGAVRWADGIAADLSTTPGAIDCIVFDLVAGIVYGNAVGTDYL